MTRTHSIDGWRIDVSVRPGVPRVISMVEVARLAARALEAGAAPRPGTLSVILTDDAEIATLNVAHLGHEGPTDVLSFPMLPPSAFPAHPGGASLTAGGAVGGAVPFVLPPETPLHLGDIVVSVERAIEQASAGRGGQTGDVRWSAADEMQLLLTHGTLHICGWDHTEPVELAAMRGLEWRLLEALPT